MFTAVIHVFWCLAVYIYLIFMFPVYHVTSFLPLWFTQSIAPYLYKPNGHDLVQEWNYIPLWVYYFLLCCTTILWSFLGLFVLSYFVNTDKSASNKFPKPTTTTLIRPTISYTPSSSLYTTDDDDDDDDDAERRTTHVTINYSTFNFRGTINNLIIKGHGTGEELRSEDEAGYLGMRRMHEIDVGEESEGEGGDSDEEGDEEGWTDIE